jgi:hypothetical protein
MRAQSVREFEITPNQYQVFRFLITRPTTLRIQLIATAPVNLVLLDTQGLADYEHGKGQTHTYIAAWGRRKDLDAAVEVDPGTWYLVVEGSTDYTRGRIEVFQ